MTGTFTEYGDRDIAVRGEILRSVVGSGVHGIAIEGTDDHDEMGVFVEPPGSVVGLRGPADHYVGGPADHYVYRTQPEGARSGPGDTDRRAPPPLGLALEISVGSVSVHSALAGSSAVTDSHRLRA
jgi:hypothetical protein